MALYTYKPDFSVVPVLAHLLAVERLINQKHQFNQLTSTLNILPKLTKAIGVEQTDCIAYKKAYLTKDLFQFANFLDKHVTTSTFLCILILSFVFGRFRFKRILHFLRILSESLFFFKSNLKSNSLFLLWITILWLFRQYFSGDMFANMTRSAGLDVIDSFADLAERKHLKILAILDFGGANPKDYFSQEMPFYKEFTKRLTMMDPTTFLAFERIVRRMARFWTKPDWMEVMPFWAFALVIATICLIIIVVS